MDYLSFVLDLWEHHRGKIIGVVIGLLIGIGFATMGFWKTVLLAICIFIGFFIGKKIDSKVSFKEFVQRFTNDEHK